MSLATKRQRAAAAEPKRDGEPASTEDTAMLSLTPEDRERLDMDSWEPSLLRKLLSAQNRLKRRRG